MTSPAASSSLIGFLLEDRYRVIREIGRGGMGAVYEGEHVQLGKPIAIKMMLEKYVDDKEAVARFQREAYAASRIGNPHIIDVSHIGTAPDGRPFVVMELLRGQPLGDLIGKVGALAPARAINIMRQVLRAVGAAHAKGIVHRDLKPDNIFLLDHDDSGDFVKLLDFGISKMMDSDAAIAATKLTTTGMVMGTPLYMAPEQAMGAPISHHADIYACGVILYEMLSGRPPFEGATYPVLIAKLLTAEPTSLRDLQPHLPAKLVAATHRALEKEPEKRFATAEHFLAALPAMDRSPSQVELAGTMASPSGSVQAVMASGAYGRDDLMYRSSGTAGRSAVAASPTGSIGAHGRSRAWLWPVGGLAVAAGAIAAFVLLRGPAPAAPATADKPAGSAAGAGSATVSPLPPPPTPTQAPVAAGSNAGSAAPGALHDPQPGRLEIKSTPDKALVTIDHAAKPIGVTRLDIVLAAGKHHIRVELPGYAPIEEDEDVESGTKESILFPLQRMVGGGAPGVRQTAANVIHSKVPVPTGPGVGVTIGPGAGPANPYDHSQTGTPATPPGTSTGNNVPTSKPNPYDTKPNPY